MTTEIFFSTNKLGNVTNEQLQKALGRLSLGSLVAAGKTSKGTGNQTLFISSTDGEYVLKGNPLYEGQFAEEKYYIDHLQSLIGMPLPSPYLIDESNDIFGWSYAIMPRLQGAHMNELAADGALSARDKEQIAEVLARSLRELHSWKAGHFGEYDPLSKEIHPFEGGYKSWLYNRIRYWLEDAKKYSTITSEDAEWAEALLQNAEGAFDSLYSPSYVMGDFKADNILVQNSGRGWEISGLFDFTNGYFGDGLADLTKITAMYVNNGEAGLAKRFIRSYMDGANYAEDAVLRLRVHMLHQCVLDWGCAKAIQQVTWDEELPFFRWASSYIIY